VEKNFYVITPVFNPAGYKSRVTLYHQFANYMASCGAKLITIELQYGELPFEVTDAHNPNHIQVRTNSVLWHKENLINVAASRLPLDWKYMAWIDADLRFVNENWMYDTCRALQFHPVVQMFAQALDLSPNNEVLRTHEGIGWAVQNGFIDQENVYKKMYNEQFQSYFHTCSIDSKTPKHLYHPGFAWAIRKEAYDGLGGLLDYPVLGSADQHMAHAFVGRMSQTLHKNYNENYKKKLMEWQDRCNKVIKCNLGYIPGSILHYWHGSKKDRGYTTRFNILIKHKYDPAVHIEKDWQGVYRWTDRDYPFHYDIMRYFGSRKEDQTGLLN